MRVYVSGALAGSRDIEQARRKYEGLGALLSAAGLTPYLPHTATDPERSPTIVHEEVFQTDMGALITSDLVVAVMDEPSLGVGAEVALALQRGIPVVGAWHKSIKVSRFVCGLLAMSPGSVAEEYETLSDVVDAVMRCLHQSGVAAAEQNGIEPSIEPSDVCERANNSMQRTGLRAAADAER